MTRRSAHSHLAAPRRRDSERGSGTLWTLGLAAVLLTATAVVATVTGATVAQHRAQAAADLAALSAVPRVADGVNSACAVAARIATAHGVTLSSCVVTPPEVAVVVEAQVDAWAWRLPLTGRARAGPSERPADEPLPRP